MGTKEENNIYNKERVMMDRKEIQEREKTGKKPYEKPKVVSEEVFETLALACCKGVSCERFGFPRGLHGVS